MVYEYEINEYLHLIFQIVKPGLTGLSQVDTANYNEINNKNNFSIESRYIIGLRYATHVSFVMDLKILMKAIIIALRGQRNY